MRFRLPCVVAFLGLLLVGCVRATQPVLKDEQVLPADPALLGKWVFEDGNDGFEVRSSSKSRTYGIPCANKDGHEETLLVRLGRVGDIMLAEIYCENPLPSDRSFTYQTRPVYDFFVVQKTKPRFVYSMLNFDWLKAYVASHPNELRITERRCLFCPQRRTSKRSCSGTTRTNTR
jgi:hypothetical protein